MHNRHSALQEGYVIVFDRIVVQSLRLEECAGSSDPIIALLVHAAQIDRLTRVAVLHFEFAQSLFHGDQEIKLVVSLGKEAVKCRARSPHEVQQHEQLNVLQLSLRVRVNCARDANYRTRHSPCRSRQGSCPSCQPSVASHICTYVSVREYGEIAVMSHIHLQRVSLGPHLEGFFAVKEDQFDAV
jgi:hypothetical protein